MLLDILSDDNVALVKDLVITIFMGTCAWALRTLNLKANRRQRENKLLRLTVMTIHEVLSESSIGEEYKSAYREKIKEAMERDKFIRADDDNSLFKSQFL
jgi:hypothetical protein